MPNELEAMGIGGQEEGMSQHLEEDIQTEDQDIAKLEQAKQAIMAGDAESAIALIDEVIAGEQGEQEKDMGELSGESMGDKMMEVLNEGGEE